MPRHSSHISKKRYAALAIIFLLPPLFVFIKRFGIAMDYSMLDKDGQNNILAGYFPSWLSTDAVFVASIIFSCLSLTFASWAFRVRSLLIRSLMLLTVVAAMCILFFNIYLLV